MYTPKDELRAHKSVHKTVAWSNCEYNCSSQTEFKDHVWRHTGEKPESVKCRYHLVMANKKEYMYHMLGHCGEKPF